MKFDRRSLTSLLAAMLAGNFGLSISEAGCPCNNGGSAYSASNMAPIPMSSYSQGSAPMGMPLAAPPVNGYGTGYGTAYVDANATIPGVGPGYSSKTATTWQPPPGTIGQTYQMKSRPVPVKMHPRAAVVDVRIPNARNVRVHDLNAYRTQDFLDGFQDDQDPDVWHFTSEPLIPGLSHIYRIEARVIGPDGEEVMDERYVRLIMGRVIEVSF